MMSGNAVAVCKGNGNAALAYVTHLILDRDESSLRSTVGCRFVGPFVDFFTCPSVVFRMQHKEGAPFVQILKTKRQGKGHAEIKQLLDWMMMP